MKKKLILNIYLGIWMMVCVGRGGGMEEGRVENIVYRGNKVFLDFLFIYVNVV